MAKNCRLDTDISALKELIGDTDEINALYAKAESIVADARKRGQDPAGALEAAKALYVRDIQASKERVLKTQVRYKDLADKIVTTGNAYKAIDSMLYSQTSGKNSIGEIPMAHLAESNFSRSAGVLSQALDEVPGSAKILESGAMDLEIRKYIKGELADASPEVRAIGDAIKKSNDRALNLKRVSGFTVGYQQNRVSRQVHSARGMADIKKQGYITEAMATFDFDKMGINTKPEQLEFVAKFYDKVVNGQRGKWEVSDELSQIARDSGKRFEEEKKIFFKDAEAEHRYNTNVNKKTLSQLIFDEMEYDSRQLAAAQQFGPNFRSSLEKLVSDQSITPTQRRELKAKFEHEVSGRFDAGTGRISSYGANIRKITDISKLSSALISTATDFAYTAGTLASNTDMNLFKASAKAVTGFFGTLPASKRKEVARHAHLYLADMISDTQANRYGGEIDTAQDALSWAHKNFMKYTGLSAQSQAARLNGAKIMMGQLADMSEKEFGALPIGVQDHFTRYGIGAKDWDKMRVASAELSDGIKVISPESIAREYGTSSADSLRMQQGLSSYLQTVAENSSPTATGAQTYWKNLIDPDTIHGQLALFFGQYKTFSFAALKTMSSIKGVHQTSAARSWALTGGTAALATGWGYTALVLKDVAAGNEPRELSPQTMLEAFDQGGAGGLYFSMMAKDWDNAYGSLAADLAGPSFKLIQDALGAGHNMLDVARYAAEGNDPKAKKAASKLLKKVYDHSPKLPLIGNAINRTILEATQRSMDLPVSKRKGKPLWQ